MNLSMAQSDDFVGVGPIRWCTGSLTFRGLVNDKILDDFAHSIWARYAQELVRRVYFGSKHQRGIPSLMRQSGTICISISPDSRKGRR